MNWFLCVMKPCVQRLVKIKVSPRAFGAEHFSGDEVEAAKSDFLNQICKHVENMLENRQCLIAVNEPTVIDMIFYNEITLVLLLLRIKGLKKMFPRLSKWISLMGDINEIDEVTNLLAKIVDEHELE